MDTHGMESSDEEFWVDCSIPSTPFADDENEAFAPEASASGVKSETSGNTSEDKEEVGDDVKSGAKEEPLGDEEVDDRQCRICFSGAEEEDSLGRLISPCLCTGSMRHVHVKCINAWRGTGSNAKAFMECPQCHHQYHIRRTLVSGLATSRPLLLVTSTALFFLLTLICGSFLHYLLLNSTTARRRLLTTNTIFDTLTSSDGVWETQDSTVIIIGGGGTLVYDVLIASIQTFTSLAIKFSDFISDLGDDLPSPIATAIFHIGIRFILGIAVLGSLSFVSLLFSMSLFGPLHLFNTFRGVGMLRNWGRRRRDGEANGSMGQIMIVLFVLIGTVNTIWGVYLFIQVVARRLLRYVETQILEVNSDDRKREAERRQRRKEESWVRRWFREQRWKTRQGWKEVAWRVWFAVRTLAVAFGTRVVERVRAFFLRDLGWPEE